MARRQEQEGARRDVSEVAPDVLRMELPIRMPGLGHVNCYALLDREGAALVDPGLPGPRCFRALEERLRQAGLSPKHIHTVLITHSHPDHFGGASKLAARAGARVLAHRSFFFGTAGAKPHGYEVSVDDLAAQEGEGAPSVGDGERDACAGELPQPVPGPIPWGGLPSEPRLRTRLRWQVVRWLGRMSIVPAITDSLEQGDVLRLAGREWFVVHTPGHTADHVCLHDPADGVFLAGDHVLPTITPHISGLSPAADPLAAFFESLDRVALISNVKRVLPAHGHPFSDLTARCREIQQHHRDRLERVKAISRELGRPAPVRAFSRRLFPPRSWGPMAESETYAHLEHLYLAGEAERSRDRRGRPRYLTG
jgi:glyoxylase-like metal-dependent hydrolase (beta-lactamase superfamily II)